MLVYEYMLRYLSWLVFEKAYNSPSANGLTWPFTAQPWWVMQQKTLNKNQYL